MANTPNLNLQEPNYNDPNWNTPLNSNFTILDTVLGTTTTISVTGLSTPQTLSTAQLQNMGINFTGVLTSNFVYNIPGGGLWFIRNSCTGAFTLSVSYNSTTVVLPVGGPYVISVDNTPTTGSVSNLGQPTIQVYAGNPNGNVAGNSTTPVSLVYDSTNNIVWVCTTTGSASTAVWIQSNLGAVTITPASLSSNQNNYNPTGIASASVLRQNSTQAVTITGLQASTDGKRLTYENISTFYHTLSNANSSSSAANRFAFNGDVVVAPGESVNLFYDATLANWKLAGFTPQNIQSRFALLEQTLTFGTPNTAWDMSLGPNATLTLIGATTNLSAPTKRYAGSSGQLNVIEDGTGGRLITFDATYKLPDGTTPTISIAPNAKTAFNWWDETGLGTIVLTPQTAYRFSQVSIASTSGTNIDFTNVPPWTKEVIVSFFNVGITSGYPLIQLGVGTPEVTGYNSVISLPGVTGSSGTTGFFFVGTGNPSSGLAGNLTIIFGNSLSASASGTTLRNDVGQVWFTAGYKSFSSFPNMLRVTTNTAGTYTAGLITVVYKG